MKDPTFIPTEQDLAREIEKLQTRVKKLEAELEDRRRQQDALSNKINVVAAGHGGSASTGDLDRIVGVFARAILAANGKASLTDTDQTTLNDWAENK